MENNRGNWGSNIGFLLAAVGSAVGLGNIWGFPYKMGISGGFSFLATYLLLAVFVGFVIMIAELAIGRRAGLGVLGAYRALSNNPASKGMLSFIGFLAMLSPFLIMSFYSVLGAYCMEYMVLNMSNLAFVSSGISGADYFGHMLVNQFGAVVYTLLFMIICYLIVKGGIKGGIEKFSNVAMPALAVMLLVIIFRSLTLPGAFEGLQFMFQPGYGVEYALSTGMIEEAPGFITVLATAGGQMFFSLSLAMGAMVTYGSYLSKKEDLVKNSLFIVVADTVVALMAGLAVIPAAFALGGEGAVMSGPKLLFITLQNVFDSMGAAGPLFGTIFYLLVLIAAITSAISLMEVQVTFLSDRAIAQGKNPNRSRITLFVFLAIMVEALVVALDGLGSNGLPQPMGFCWLDFMDLWSEGIAMPLGALLMSLLIGWVVGPKVIKQEVCAEGNSFHIYTFFNVCLRFIVPVAMVLILVGQLDTFFGLGIF